MADSALKERLLNSQKAFDGLLSLIPAKMYYGEDKSDQWKQKKQTKAQAAEARRNKLDPDSALNRSAKDVMDEQARKKRKRDQMQDGDEDGWSEVDGIEPEQPRQGMKKKTAKEAKKKQKQTDEETELTEKEKRKEEKRAARKERKAERQALRDEEAEFNRRSIKGVNKIKLGARPTNPNTLPSAVSETEQPVGEDATEVSAQEDAEDIDDAEDAEDSEMPEAEEEQDSASVTSPIDTPQSPIFDTNGTPADSTGHAPSTSTSVSSTDPTTDKPKLIKIPADSAALRARLAARIQALRDARKADKDGKPIRTRQELIESRRQKQAERKAHKKELRQKARLLEEEKREEALASARGSPRGLLSPKIDIDDENVNFAFGRVGFGDGSQLSHDLTHVLNKNQKKGPIDPKSALQKVENQKKRLAAMDDDKRKDVEEKEVWLTARRRAEGEKIRDDEKMLKKASTKEWAARKEGVAKGIQERQRKREENIRNRRDEKLLGKAGKKKGGFAKKSKPRAGFEGSTFGKKR
ncbi:SURF6-domain-containing protein [Xylariaceae sp. FL1019]|nr:SURF6-domain-containing protein [Xylariaceae sp. FL1019]